MSTPLTTAPFASGIVVYCRAGFESEAAQELDAIAAQAGVAGFARTERNSGFSEFVLTQQGAPDALLRLLGWSRLIFGRQSLAVIGQFKALPREDRLTPLLAVLPPGFRVCDIWVETPDSDASSRSPRSAAVSTMPSCSICAAKARSTPRVRGDCMRCSRPANAACSRSRSSIIRRCRPQGIPRLKFPREAPSRSTLKLDEALQVLLSAANANAGSSPA